MTQLDQIVAAQAALESPGRLMRKIEEQLAEKKTRSAKRELKLQIQRTTWQMQDKLAGPASTEAIFYGLTRAWVAETDSPTSETNRLLIHLDADWGLMKAILVAPLGPGLAEELMRESPLLNVRQLAIPIEVRYFPFSMEEGLGKRAHCSAFLSGDGTLGDLRTSFGVVGAANLKEEMKKKLVANGIPPVTKLEGRSP